MNTERRDLAHIAQLHNTIRALRARIRATERSPITDCYNRADFEYLIAGLDLIGMSFAYWDVDGLRRVNDEKGKLVASARMRWSINARETDCLVGHIFSGDEYGAVIPHADAFAYCSRIQSRFHRVHMSATFVLLDPREFLTIQSMFDAGDKLCTQLKSVGLKGRIVDARRQP